MRLRSLGFLVLAVLAGTPVFAGKTRVVKSLHTEVFTYAIVDATTQRPVIGATVSSGGQTAVTNALGGFSLSIIPNRPVAVTVHRTGYEDFTFIVQINVDTQSAGPVSGGIPNAGTSVVLSLPPGSSSTVSINQGVVPLVPRAVATVKMTNGDAHTLDTETVQFAYVLPFATPQASNTPSFCRVDGTAWSPERAEIAQITGPAKQVTSAPCCKLGKVLAVDVKMKTGETETVSFTDSCFGYDIVLSARDHDSAQYVYYRFADVATVTFP